MMSVSERAGWRPFQVGRKGYFLFAGLLVGIIALLPPLSFGSGPAVWLLLFTARIRDIGRPKWNIPAFLLVALEMFNKETVKGIYSHYGQEWTGYFVIALLITHVVFGVALGMRRSAPRPSAS